MVSSRRLTHNTGIKRVENAGKLTFTEGLLLIPMADRKSEPFEPLDRLQ